MSSQDPPSKPIQIRQAFHGQRIFITGATGFLGKVLVEKLLWSVPDLGKLLLLIRPPGESAGAGTAEDRLQEELLRSPLTARLRAFHGDSWQEWVADKVEVVPGDLGQDRFGLSEGSYETLCRGIDRIVGNAATVTFDERIDRSVSLNIKGVERTLQLARDAGNVPLLHVSTCFVSGRREGLIEEEIVGGGALDFVEAFASLEASCADLEDGQTKGDRPWIEAGAAQARRYGFHDIYTLTKALGERLLAREQGDVPIAVLRPAIVESAAREPIPGWIGAVRVSDPLLVAYGRGRTRDFPGFADTPLELVPVDYVVNAVISALAALPKQLAPPEQGEPIPVYQLGSNRNPVTLSEVMEFARSGFERHPLWDSDGMPILLETATFSDPEHYRETLLMQRKRIRRLLRWGLRWVPGRRASQTRVRLSSTERSLDHLIHLLEVYRPYLRKGPRYDDTRSRLLWECLSPEERQIYPFDISEIDWQPYIAEVHVPGLIRFALKAETGTPVPQPRTEWESPERILQRAREHAAAANTVFDLFSATAESYPDVMAFQTCRQGRWLRYTYRQAQTAAANLALRLQRQYAVRPGSRVVLWATGSPEWVIATLAIHRLGATSVPVDPQWPAGEMVQAARLVEASLICAAPRLADAAIAAVEAGSNEPGAELEIGSLTVAVLGEPFVPAPEVELLPGAEAIGSAGDSTDLASIIFTSGTTVAPKAVPLTHGNYLANVRDLIPLMELTRERLLSVLPIHHVFEQMVGLWVPLSGGSTFSYVSEIKPVEISWMMATTRPTVLVAVPRLLELLHNGIRQSVKAGGFKLKMIFRILFALSRRTQGAKGHKLFSKVHQRFGGSLRRIATGGSALEPSLGRSFQLMGFKVAEGYGMTETSPVMSVNPWNSIRFGSVGRLLEGVEVEIRQPSETLEDLAPGAGEVWVRGANVMAGYYQNPDATAEVMRDGWLNTGDIGFFDDDGYLHLSGRTKDVIVTSAGKNVYPEEVEARYREIPGIADLVILGLPAEGAGERVTALVVPAAGADEAQIRAAIEERSKTVPSYQQVSQVEWWSGDLPKTTTMKVKRAVLRDAVLAGERGVSAPSLSPLASTPSSVRSPEVQEEILDESQKAVVETISRLTRTRSDLIHSQDRLRDLGVDSLTRVELVGELEARFGFRLDDDQAAALSRVQDLFDLAS